MCYLVRRLLRVLRRGDQPETIKALTLAPLIVSWPGCTEYVDRASLQFWSIAAPERGSGCL